MYPFWHTISPKSALRLPLIITGLLCAFPSVSDAARAGGGTTTTMVLTYAFGSPPHWVARIDPLNVQGFQLDVMFDPARAHLDQMVGLNGIIYKFPFTQTTPPNFIELGSGLIADIAGSTSITSPGDVDIFELVFSDLLPGLPIDAAPFTVFASSNDFIVGFDPVTMMTVTFGFTQIAPTTRRVTPGVSPHIWDPDTLYNNGTTGGAGTWNTSSNSWDDLPVTQPSPSPSPFNDTAWNNATHARDIAVFGGNPGSGNVTVAVPISAGGFQFDNSGYHIQGNIIGLSAPPGRTPTIDTGANNAMISSTLAGNSGLTKVGTGTLTLTGANNYTGTTTINAGTLLVNNAAGSGTGNSAVIVNNSGSVLGGTGAIGGPVNVNSGGAVLGGNGATASGALTLANDLTLNPGSIIKLALGAFGTHSTLNRAAGNWTFAPNQTFTFINVGAQPGFYDNIITGLAADPGGEASWTITNNGSSGTFTYDGAGNIDLNLTIGTCPATVLANDNSTSVNARAPMTRFRFERSVYLITAAELAANGYSAGASPMSIGWNYQTAPGVAGAAPLIIYMQNTSDTTNTKSTSWSAAISGMTVVHNTTTNLPAAAGPFDIMLSGGSPFTYTGGGLYIAFDWGQYAGTLSTTAVVWCNSTGLLGGLLGAQSNTAPPTTVAPSNFRPETRLSSATQNDASVDAVYSLGELPLGVVPAQIIMAVVTNKGAVPMTNLPVTLNVTGADTFTDMQTIPSLASCGAQSIVTFAAFTPGALGSDMVTVSVPADDITTNDSLSKPLSITALSYSYKYPGSTASGGVGLTGATGAFVGKFTTTAANAVTDVKLEFAATSATTYRVAIYGDSGSGTPSTTALYVDAADRTVSAPGPVTITLPSPVAVGPGNFYVGIQQTNTTNAVLSFDNEAPIRSSSFYFATPNPPATWTDFSPGNNFKINIGVILQTPGSPTATQVVSRKIHGATPFDITLPAGIECRSGGATNDYQVVFTFATPVTFTGAAVTAGVGSVSGTSGNGTTDITVDLTGVTNAQRITITVSGVNNGTSTGDVAVQMGVLVGDTNGNGSVNAGDVAQTKGQSGQAVTAANFREDVNANASINAGDVALVKSKSGTMLPP